MRNATTCLALVLSAPAFGQSTIRISSTNGGLPPNNTASVPSCSSDGRFIAYSSTATNLHPNDTNGVADCFVFDRATGVTECVSVTSSGSVGNGESRFPRISGDGRWVVIQSSASDLVPNDTNNEIDALVYDRVTGSMQRANLSYNGQQTTGLWIVSGRSVEVSADGQLVAFVSSSTQLVPPDMNGSYTDICVRNLTTGVNELINVSSAGVQSARAAYGPRMSADGRFVAFNCLWTLHPSVPTGNSGHVYLRDRLIGTTEVVSVDVNGAPASNAGGTLDVSDDGRFVLFTSANPQTSSLNSPNSHEVYLRDMVLGTNTLVSVSSSGAFGNQSSGSNVTGALSADGRYALFDTFATNFDPTDTNLGFEAYLRDLHLGVTTRIGLGSLGQQANGPAYTWSMSDDATVIPFSAYGTAAPFTPGDASAPYYLTYARLMDSTCPAATTYCTAKINSAGCTPTIGAAGEPRLSGFDSFFVTARNVLNQKSGLFFWGSNASATPFGGGTRCVSAPVVRTAVQESGGSLSGSDCTGTYSFRPTQAYWASHNITAGVPLYGQYWSRDPGFAAPQNVGLTDGIAFTPWP